MSSQFADMTSSSFFFFRAVFFSLSNLITDPSFKSMPSLVMEL